MRDKWSILKQKQKDDHAYIVKVVCCDTGRGVKNTWRKASFFSSYRGLLSDNFSYILKHLHSVWYDLSVMVIIDYCSATWMLIVKQRTIYHRLLWVTMHATMLNMAKCIKHSSNYLWNTLHNLICFCTVLCK